MADMDQARRRLAMMGEEAPEEATNLQTNEDVADEGWRDVLKFFLEDKENAPGDDSIQSSMDPMDLFPPEAAAGLMGKLGALKGMPLLMAAIKRETPTGKTLRMVGKSRAKPLMDEEGYIVPGGYEKIKKLINGIKESRLKAMEGNLGHPLSEDVKWGSFGAKKIENPFTRSFVTNKTKQRWDLEDLMDEASRSHERKTLGNKELEAVKKMKALMGE